MELQKIYQKFPSNNDCFKHLEQIRWGWDPVCPYCKSKNYTEVLKEERYHCNSCNTSFRVTVGTIFHNTKLNLQKWFLAIHFFLNTKNGISSRQLAKNLDINKNTAGLMLARIRKGIVNDEEMFKKIAETNEAYI
jgi:transposase-like protein